MNEKIKKVGTSSAKKDMGIIAGVFVGVLLISNVASTKIFGMGIPSLNINIFGLKIDIDFVLDGGTVLFPISYIFGDVLTEVYGFINTRKVIWTGFIMAAVMSLTFLVVGALPADAYWNSLSGDGFTMQEAFQSILGQTPMIVIASLIAYFFGNFTNSIIMSKMKISQDGKDLWKRTILSTIVGEGVDTIIFATIAFGITGIIPISGVIGLIILNYIFKVLVEVVMTPVTYRVVNLLKRRAGEDVYDHGVKYRPM